MHHVIPSRFGWTTIALYLSLAAAAGSAGCLGTEDGWLEAYSTAWCERALECYGSRDLEAEGWETELDCYYEQLEMYEQDAEARDEACDFVGDAAMTRECVAELDLVLCEDFMDWVGFETCFDPWDCE